MSETPAAPEAAEASSPPAIPDAPIDPAAPVFEMFWDCRYCGTRKLLGKTHRFCPNCGAAQEPSARYFPSDAEKVAVKDHVYHGADRVCPSCATASSARAEFCPQCGTPLSDAARAGRRATERRAEGEAFAESGPPDPDAERQKTLAAALPTLPGVTRARIILVAIGLLLLCGVVAYALTRKDTATVTVVDREWVRAIDVEAYGPVSGSDWCDSLPAGAYAISRHQAVRYHEQVPDGERCDTLRIDNGDGTYREERTCYPVFRSEPVYADRCDYRVNTWAYARTVEARGTAGETPAWPALDLAGPGGACIGCEREAGRHARYTVYFSPPDSEGRLSCTFDDIDAWRPLRPGTAWALEVGTFTGAPDCGSLRAAELGG